MNSENFHAEFYGRKRFVFRGEACYNTFTISFLGKELTNMYQFSIGVILDRSAATGRPLLKKRRSFGADGIQAYATYGELSPYQLNAQQRKEVLKQVKAHGLRFSALCGDLGEGFANRERNPKLIEHSKAIIDLALDLETNIVTTHIGVVPCR